jgi:Leu/Phe-tRNA-protein transferase
MRARRVEVIPPEVLLQAYAQGYFPMADSESGRIQWYSADPRAVLPLEPFHIPRRLARSLKTAGFITDASKAALVYLADRLRERGFRMLEIQMITPLTEQFGAVHVPRADYGPLLAEALAVDCRW